MAGVPTPRIPAGDRYQGPIACPSLWRGVHKDGSADPATEIRVLSAHPDGGYLYEWIHQGNAEQRCPKQLGHAPEENLRRIFRPVEPLPEPVNDGIHRISIREITEGEARAWFENEHRVQAPPRFVIVDHAEQTKALYHGLHGALGIYEGTDWLHCTILKAREWERRRSNVVLVLTPGQRMIERVGIHLGSRTGGLDVDLSDDGPAAAAKLQAIARAVIPEAFYSRGGGRDRARV